MEIYRKASSSDDRWVRIACRPSKDSNWKLSGGASGPEGVYQGPTATMLYKRCAISERRKRDYRVELSFSDVADLIDMLSSKGHAEYDAALSSALSDSVRSLQRLISIASGLSVAEE